MKINEQQRVLAEAALGLGSTALIVAFMIGAFERAIAQQIKERARWECESCGRKSGRRLDASHRHHSRATVAGLEYNHPDRGEALCLPCHYLYHASYVHHPEEIGLNTGGNDAALQMLWDRMSELERDWIERMEKSLEKIVQTMGNWFTPEEVSSSPVYC